MLSLSEIEELPFVFIVGRGRSGTTLLQTLLDANPSIIIPVESRLIIHLKQKYFHVNLWTTKLIEEFIIDLYREKEFSQSWNVNKKTLSENIHSYPLNQLTFSSLCKIIYLNYPSPFTKTKTLLIGDKKPRYSIFIADLLEVFPNAKFIHLVRDYRDNIVSNKKVFLRQNVALLAQAWKTFNRSIEKEKKKKPSAFYTIKYEDLASYPEKKVMEICTFLGIPFYSEMLSSYKKVNELNEQTKYIALTTLHSNLLNPINTSQINKWKKHLSPSEIEIIDYITGDFAKLYGYIPESKTRKLFCFLKSFIGVNRHKIDIQIFKFYYRAPSVIRNTLNLTSRILHKLFSYSNYYNRKNFQSYPNSTENAGHK